MPNYLISISKNEALKNGVIHDPCSRLKVKAFDLGKANFNPCKNEVAFYVTAGEEALAFETRGFKEHHQLLILQMISWYCIYLGLIEAQIHSSWPALSA